MIKTLSSLAAPEVVTTTTSGASSDDKFGIMVSLGFGVISTNAIDLSTWCIAGYQLSRMNAIAACPGATD